MQRVEDAFHSYRVWQVSKNKLVIYQTYCAGTDSPAWVLSEVGSDRESDVKAALTSPACDSLCAALVENYSLTDSPASMTTHQLLSTLRMDRYGEEAVGTMEKGHVSQQPIQSLSPQLRVCVPGSKLTVRIALWRLVDCKSRM